MINIYEPVAEICARLGLDPNFVKEITLHPTQTDVVVFAKKGGVGAKFVGTDGEPVTENLTFDTEARP